MNYKQEIQNIIRDNDIKTAANKIYFLFSPVQSETMTIAKIKQVVSEKTAIPIWMFKADTRKRDIVRARQLVMYFAHKKTDYTTVEIGKNLTKNHATVLHSVTTIQNLIDTDRKFREFVNQIETKLNEL